ncbi:UDP-N-acetylmuramate dehydrogenase [Patescibacteria group bacterium]|nr:UDP-N-acetylmuramate dehydrogenase [Patescibacteria group bacterium]
MSNKKVQEEFIKKFPEGKIDEILKNHCTFQIGGPADLFYEVRETAQIPELIRFAITNNLPYLLIGRGSNILFPDDGFRGLIIKNQTDHIEESKDQFTADSGTLISRLTHLSPLEQWVGLPGTVGGAIYGNAGYNGLETKDILKSAQIYDPQTDQIQEIPATRLDLKYRHSALKNSKKIILKATFTRTPSTLSPEQLEQIKKESRHFRLNVQPFGASSGSFFKNPNPQQPAGLLIDQAGLKGHSIGDAQISEKHANFIINTGSATAKDVRKLATLIKKEVKAKFGIKLEEEVQII